jgi:peptide/nickel transport system substrate-binding protein
MTSNYWSKVTRQRITRRRALLVTAAGAAGSALVLACGGDDEGGGGGAQTTTGPSTGATSGAGPTVAPTSPTSSGLLGTAEDTSAQAVTGGVFQTYRTDDALTLDPISNTSSLSWTDMLHVYSHLTKAGLKSPNAAAFEGDAASSWEVAPDGSRVTFKIRQGMNFDPRPPTNGRPLTSADVKWSFDKFEEVSPYRGEIFNELSPAAPITSVEAPDEQTFVVNLAFPYGGLIEMVGYLNYFYIVPTDAENIFNMSSEMRGTGPFRLTSYQPSVGFEYERNDDWYVQDRPFLDGVKRTIIPDYSAGLSQFEAGNLWAFTINQEDVLRTKDAYPKMVMLQVQEGALGISNLQSTPYIAMSKREESPLRDIRVRQAASMLLDRDLWIQTFYNTQAFEDAGLPVKSYWHNHLPALAPSWLDPQGSEIGEGAKFFQYNPEEAATLMKAAAQDGVELDYFYQNRESNWRTNEVLFGMLQEGGLFKINAQQLDYRTEWRDTCQYSAGEGYMGFCFNNSGAFNEDAYMVAKYTPEGKYAASYLPIDGVTDAVLDARQELDAEERSAKIKEIQRKLAIEKVDIPMPGITQEFTLRWAWLKNHDVFNSGGQTALDFVHYWYDESERA